MAEGLSEAMKTKLANTIKSTGFPINVLRFYRGCLKIRQGASFIARNSQAKVDGLLQEASNAIPQTKLPPPPLTLVNYIGEEVPKHFTLLDHCVLLKLSQPSRLKSHQKLFIISNEDLKAFRVATSQKEKQTEEQVAVEDEREQHAPSVVVEQVAVEDEREQHAPSVVVEQVAVEVEREQHAPSVLVEQDLFELPTVGDQQPTVLLEVSIGGPHSPHPGDLDDTIEDEPSAVEERGRMFRRRINSTMGTSEQSTAAAHSAYDALWFCLSPNVRRIQVKRDSILEDVLQLYEKEDVMQQHLEVDFVVEDGLDLVKDMFSAFWIEAFKNYFTGENVFVPFLPIARQNEANRIYPLLGRILSHTAALLRNIPVRLCRSTLLTICHSPAKADDECLLHDVMNFVTGSERRILEMALRDYESLDDSNREEVSYIFGRFGMGAIIRKENITNMVVNLARQELCIKPLFLCTLIRSGIPENHRKAFWENLSTAEVNKIYKALLPTTSGVINLLKTEHNLRPEEDVILYYLRDFIRRLGDEDLSLFLRFVMGQDLMPQEPIRVMFRRMEGISRRPIAHTCSNLLELSLCYETIQDFSREFIAVLRDPACYVMDTMGAFLWDDPDPDH